MVEIMDLDNAKFHASKLLNVGKSRIWINPSEGQKIKDAITKDDLRALISEGVVKKRKDAFQSRAHARKLLAKKRKGLRKRAGSRKAKKSARVKPKKQWISRVRAQRRTLRELLKESPEKVKKAGYRKLYNRIKGNFFRGKKYLEKALE